MLEREYDQFAGLSENEREIPQLPPEGYLVEQLRSDASDFERIAALAYQARDESDDARRVTLGRIAAVANSGGHRARRATRHG